jgi:hypothetical protein
LQEATDGTESSVPAPVKAPVLNRFRDMFRGYRFRAVEIGHCAGHFQYPVVRAGRETHASHGHFERPLAGFVRARTACESSLWAFGNCCSREHVESHAPAPRAIDAVEQGPADLAEIPLDDRGCAAAFARCVAIVAAPAPPRVSTALWNESSGSIDCLEQHGRPHLRISQRGILQHSPFWQFFDRCRKWGVEMRPAAARFFEPATTRTTRISTIHSRPKVVYFAS